MEGLEVVKLLAGRGKGDRLADDLLDGQRRTTAGIAVELGQDDTVEFEGVVERLRGVDGVLTGHRVDDEEGVIGLDLARDLADLLHQRLVDRQTAGGVDDDDVAAGAFGLRDRLRGDVDGIGRFRENRHTDLAGEGAELFDRRGSLQVGAHEQGVAPLLLEPLGELAGVGGLTCTLQTRHEHDGGRFRGVGDLHRLATEAGGQLLENDLDDLLSRIEGVRQLLPHRPLANATDEVLGDVEVDVGFQQGEADLAQDIVDVRLGQLAAAAEATEDPVESIGQCLEHGGVRVAASPVGQDGGAVGRCAQRRLGHPASLACRR